MRRLAGLGLLCVTVGCAGAASKPAPPVGSATSAPAPVFKSSLPPASALDVRAVESRLRESLEPGGGAASAEREEEEDPESTPEPPMSCQPLVSEVSAKPSALPAWAELRPGAGPMTSFPSPDSTHDELPTFERLARQLCSAPDPTSVLAGAEQAGAFRTLAALVQSCEPSDVCRLGVALTDSRYQRLRAELAPELLLQCDAATAGTRLSDLHAPPLMQLEWLVAGRGRHADSAGKVAALLEQILASKDRSDIEQAVAVLGWDGRPEITALALATRARAKRRPLAIEGVGNESFGVDQFDLALRAAQAPTLRDIHRVACLRLAKRKDQAVQDGCSDLSLGVKAGILIHYRSERGLTGPRRAQATTLPRLLGVSEERECARALGGECPDLPAFAFDAREPWGALYQIAVDLAEQPGSPISGALLDTALRSTRDGRSAAWKLWLGGQVYEASATAQAQLLLPWAEQQPKLPASGALAVRGYLAWFNGIARARGSSQRLFYVHRHDVSFIVMATEAQACALSPSNELRFSQEPVTRR